MNEFKRTEHGDEAMLMLDLSDEALENAAGSVWEKAGALTLAFCSGIDSCPSSVRLKAIEQVLASCFSAKLSNCSEAFDEVPTPGTSSIFLTLVYCHLPRIALAPPAWSLNERVMFPHSPEVRHYMPR